VPISNYLGWFFVAVIAVALFQSLDNWLNRGPGKPLGALPTLPSRALLGPMLYAGIVSFGIAMLFAIGANDIAWASVFIYLPCAVLILHIVTRGHNDTAAVVRHLADFPYDAPALLPGAFIELARRSSSLSSIVPE
jgi:hypothetical protein